MNSWRNGAQWSASEIAKLDRYYKQGMSLEKIASTLNRTPCAIESALTRKLKKGKKRGRVDPAIYKWNEEQIEELRVLWLSDMSVRGIARTLNRSTSSIRNAAMRHLGLDYDKRDLRVRVQQSPRTTQSGLAKWNNESAQEHKAWQAMVNAKTFEEKREATRVWEELSRLEEMTLKTNRLPDDED